MMAYINTLIISSINETLEYFKDHDWSQADQEDFVEIRRAVELDDQEQARILYDRLDTEPAEAFLDFVPDEDVDAVLDWFDA